MDAPGKTTMRKDAEERTQKLGSSLERKQSSSAASRTHQEDPHGADRESAASEGPDAEEDDAEEGHDNEDSDEEDKEPRLKYTYLSKLLGSVYRNGDATSTFLIIGTHNGVIHVLSLPHLQPLRVYHAHAASVTSISISPFPPPLPRFKVDAVTRSVVEDTQPPTRASTSSGSIRGKPKSNQQSNVPLTPSNSIHIASSSIDGNVCIASLIDPKDILKRNFGRPVQAVALSPDYKNDRSFISGGRAGELILTTGGRIGVSANATTMGGASATASSWLGSMGLAASNGKDTILHSGEGTISTIRWSLSGRYVTWVNEEGIKIMRSNLHLEPRESEFAWRRISHIDRPSGTGWDEMAGVWKARAEWIDDSALDQDDRLDPGFENNDESSPPTLPVERPEKLVVGWGGTVWIIDVFPDRACKSSKGQRYGSAEVSTILRTDCIISGISLYSPRLLVVLAHIEGSEDVSEDASVSSGRGHRPKNLEPELRIIDIETKEELSADTLSFGRFQNLTSSDYHLSVLPPWKTAEGQIVQRGALGTIGHGLLDATLYPARLFSSAASIRSTNSSGDKLSARAPPSFISKQLSFDETPSSKEVQDISRASGAKIFVHSPFDCVVSIKRDFADRLAWLNARGQYEQAWNLIDQHPEVAESTLDLSDIAPGLRSQSSLGEFFADDRSSVITAGRENLHPAADHEKARIGELWIEQLVSQDKWFEAAEVCGKALRSTPRWEHWAWLFIERERMDEILPHLPINLHPPLSAEIYESLLNHYVSHDLGRFRDLVDSWPSDLFDSNNVTQQVRNRLQSHSVTERSDDWQTLTDCLAKLYLMGGHYREALRCYIRLQDADATMSLIKEHHLVDAVSDDIPAFVMIRITKQQMKSAPKSELDELAAEPIQLLVREAYTGIVPPETVVSQLKAANRILFVYFYLRVLWRGEALTHDTSKPRRGRGTHSRDAASKLAADEGKALIDALADTAVEVFADYDRSLLMEFLQTSMSYTFELATQICEQRRYTQELIYLLSKMGQTKRALNLILSDLTDVSQAISFAKSQDDPDLWEDLLDYSMDKPKFIHGLLVEAGTSIDPIKLVRRIPSGLEIEGLRDGLTRLIREHDLQTSISQGAARVMQSEVARGMDTLRKGQRRGIKFNVNAHESASGGPGHDETSGAGHTSPRATSSSGRCGGCNAPFKPNEREILVGFGCGHIFHLSHLHSEGSLPQSNTDSPNRSADRTPRPSSPIEEVATSSVSRTVGPKVTTARLLRDRIGDGCRICALSRKIESLGSEEAV
ncbi:Uncharacterized protein PECH_007834 [Penicillium ucsense]|uniref:Vps41 beta-propeller domain-containing protein n=1 Tax=Penicillium ucsense TaxID=2839758 RepID=A0A8J8W2A5_9EURO|nr:Uncharacterized protein PECM_007647 [Penicillium ucsense]KAF7734644.1 Uncharacterized protein PECH_007834 [Penicillium ucsense]